MTDPTEVLGCSTEQNKGRGLAARDLSPLLLSRPAPATMASLLFLSDTRHTPPRPCGLLAFSAHSGLCSNNTSSEGPSLPLAQGTFGARGYVPYLDPGNVFMSTSCQNY